MMEVETTDKPEYTFTPDQRHARRGAAVIGLAIGPGLAYLGARLIDYGPDVMGRGIGAVTAAFGIALSTITGVIYYHGDADISPHRIHHESE